MDPKTTTIPNPLGTRFVATWPEDCSGWQVTRYEPGEAPVSADAFVDSLPSRVASSRLASFLEQPSPMAVFELDCDGLRKVVGVKLLAPMHNPTFVRQALTDRTELQELDRVHPVLMRLSDLVSYHWGSPGFLDLCEVMGFDPQTVRPRFRARFDGLAQELLRWSCTVKHGTDASWESPQSKTRQAVAWVLEMMRADAYPGPGRLDDLRQCWEGTDRTLLPRFGELDRLVNSDELLDTTGLDDGVIQPRTPPSTSLILLPSRHGPGCEATITGYFGQHEPDGWMAADCANLRGIATEPDRNALWKHAWLRAAVRRLREQGVLFLTPVEARAYMASNEAAYWAWRGGGRPMSRFIRRATGWQRLLWRMWPPALPRDCELAAHRRAGTAR